MAPPPVPIGPSNLTAEAISANQINLNWKDNSTTEKGFYVYRTIVMDYIKVVIIGANSTSYKDTGLTPETTYRYRVSAYNDQGESAKSNEASATTSSEPLPPLEPVTNLSATVKSYKQINLSWADNSTTEDGFRVRCNIGHTRTNTIATVGPDTTRYKHCELQPMTHHKYYIEAFRGEETAGCPQVSATTPCPVELFYFSAQFISSGLWVVKGRIFNDATEPCLVELTARLYRQDTGRCVGTAKPEFYVNAGAINDFYFNMSQESEPVEYPPCDCTLEITDVEIDY